MVLALVASLASTIAYAQLSADETYKPYGFRYETLDPDGNVVEREESQDQNGNIISKVIMTTREGLRRITTTVAHPEEGTSVKVETNEPGVVSHEAANAIYLALN